VNEYELLIDYSYDEIYYSHMIDLSRRDFLIKAFKFSATSAAVFATIPVVDIYQEKVEPVLSEKFKQNNLPVASNNLSFLQKMMPHLLMGGSIMSLLMVYSDQLELFAIVLLAALSLIFIGIPVTETTLSYFL
tara:strand:- start:4070 stop:4468 length:399 start_codon:yes stop_codon:yes gene_type:complete